ncbi:SdpI family protein [Rhodococcus sp. UNC363MFTsu5.1]|uniref:SdpI family protein n=1 Tax=Rhodococcus sp. UNC363MFTsu5.1 TaxID=1449069 RepID=UPI00055D82C7|nr:SdpI family protein [Rhodococcus sp. UNC363MFTsu5.1]
MVIVATVLFVVALAIGVVAVAGITGRLPRNRWAGVTTPEALASDDAFRLANRIAAPTMAAAALLLVIGGVGALAFGTAGGLLTVAVALVAALVTAGYGGSMGARAAAAAAPAGGCGHDCGCGSPAEPESAEFADNAADAAAAADCGMDSCGSCALKGACLPS